jgi:N-acylneuraminate cytidylyltransferase
MSPATSLAVIPARGGSRRIPRKNIVDFLGRPLIAWTIAAARESGCFGAVLVSTDDAEIAEIARSCGATVPFLRQNNSDDQAPSSLATIEALMQYADWSGRMPEVVAQLLPTCPLRGTDLVRAAHADFTAHDADFLLSCTDFGPLNPWWAATLEPDGRPRPLFPEAMTKRSQDLPPAYMPSGAIWLARVPALLAARSFYGPGHRYWPMGWLAGFDIDTPEDLAIARALAGAGRS